jgi:tRNA1Val (adenine37-N6)-methyltransferase
LAGVLEPRRGYRFRPENAWLPVLLAGGGSTRVVDLGAGSGSLLLGAWYALGPERAVGVEIQAEAADRLGRTLAAHGIRGGVAAGDLRDPAVLERTRDLLGGPADLVVTNPPFFPPGWGRPSARDEVHRATHALAGGVAEFLAAAKALLAPGGRVWIVYDAGRLAVLFAAAAAVHLTLGRLELLPDPRGAPYRAWIELGEGGAAIGVPGASACHSGADSARERWRWRLTHRLHARFAQQPGG